MNRRNPVASIPGVLKRTLNPAAIQAMIDIKARRPDWLLYLRLLRLVTHDAFDPDQGETFGVVQHGQSISRWELLDHFPNWTVGQLEYRLRKLMWAGLLIRNRTRYGHRLALLASNLSLRQRVPVASLAQFPWLRRPVQLALFPVTELSALHTTLRSFPVAA